MAQHTYWLLVSRSPEEAKVPRSRAHTGAPAASGFSGSPQIGLPKCGHRYNSRRHQRHQGSALSLLRQQGSPRICHRRRDPRKTCPRQVVASSATEQGQGPYRCFDRHCTGDTSSTKRRKGQLSSGQFGAGDVSARRTIPQAIGENLPCLARRHCHGFAEGATSGNCSPQLESRRGCQLSDRDGRGLRLVSKECSRCEGVGSGNHKYRWVAEVSSGASSISARGTTCHESRSRQRVVSCSWI